MTKIPWTEITVNPWVGCTKCATGCLHCYAEQMARRLRAMGHKAYADVVGPHGKWTGKIGYQMHELDMILRLRKPRMIFLGSMTDIFHEDVPFEYIDRAHAIIALCPQHTFQVLTKRIERAMEYYMTRTSIDDSYRVDRMPQWYNVLTGWLDEGHKGYLGRNWDRFEKAAEQTDFNDKPLPNLWLGTSISTQADADKNIPILLQIPASVRFISLEPMLERIDFRHINACGGKYIIDVSRGLNKIDWVIIGCESGLNARLCSIEDVRNAVNQYRESGVACFVKQVPINGKCSNKPAEWPLWAQRQEYPK